MKKMLKQPLAVLCAAVLGLSSMPLQVTAEESFLFTIEGEEMEGADLWTSIYENQIPGYSGEGFAYLTAGDLSFTVTVPKDGMYDVRVRGAQILNEEPRMQTVAINGIEYSKYAAYSAEWTDYDFGYMRFKEGENTVSFVPKYGYMAIDTVTVETAQFPDLTKADSETCDPDATPEAKAVLAYLHSVYGKHILSGQQEIYGGGHSVETTIRYDAGSDTCVDSDGKTYIIDKDSYDTTESGEKFPWHCTDPDSGQVYTYSTQNRNYTYNDYNYEMKYIENLTGELPAIHGFDFGSYCPCYAWDDGVAGRMIEWTKEKGGICTASWHVNVPVDMADYTLGEPLAFEKTTYSERTNFVTANCMVEGTAEYDYFQLCMKNLAAELQKLQDAGVPVLWRPFHEAEGNGGFYTDEQGNITGNGKGAWFWWAKEGSDVYNALWKFLYKTLTEEYGLHNLIWEQNLYAWSDDSANWYTGDEWVDIVGYDKYNTQYNRHDGKQSGVPNEDAESGLFWALHDMVNGKKMVSMPENDSIPSLENLEIEEARWLYFCPWYDTPESPFLSGAQYQDPEKLTELYQSEYCITLDELPDLFGSGQGKITTEPKETTTKAQETTTKAQETTTKAQETTTVSSETTAAGSSTDGGSTTTASATATQTKPATPVKVSLYGDVNVDNVVDITDAILLNKAIADAVKLSPEAAANADVDVDSELTQKDSIGLLQFIVQTVKELPLYSFDKIG